MLALPALLLVQTSCLHKRWCSLTVTPYDRFLFPNRQRTDSKVLYKLTGAPEALSKAALPVAQVTCQWQLTAILSEALLSNSCASRHIVRSSQAVDFVAIEHVLALCTAAAYVLPTARQYRLYTGGSQGSLRQRCPKPLVAQAVKPPAVKVADAQQEGMPTPGETT
jgi:hypothetical protein